MFCSTVRRDSASLLRFPFLSHGYDLSNWSCFSSHICFPLFLSVVMLLMLLLAAVISLSLYFFYVHLESLYCSIYIILCAHQSSSSLSSLGCCIVINFLVLWSIHWSSSLVYFKNDYVTFHSGQTNDNITIYIYFLDGRLCEVGAVRRGIRIIRLWGLDSSV